ncbi:G-protein coupled receptor Mth2 isoform X2 [Ptiloglossa arizonensis]|uniref:G-protein coupled receptor Mth2 isoform X2 n=1 Tax=Ptiloglossa arizonensis TaxID=3350558 RepID=UPI003F9FD3F9
MSTRGLVLLGLVLVTAGASAAKVAVRKCCPPGEIFSGETEVGCVPVLPRAMELYSVDYGNAAVQQNGFPICKEIKDISTTPLATLNTTDFLQIPPCVEILHEQTTEQSVPIVVHCLSNEDRNERYETVNTSLPRLLGVRRCCPKNTVFDLVTKSCVSFFDVINDGNYSDIDEFRTLLPKVSNVDFFNISRGLSDCRMGAVFTYEIAAEDIIFENGTLQVMLPSSATKSEWFSLTGENSCLELTADSWTKRQLVLRVCRSSELCQNNSCIRKCCPENQVFAKSECTKLNTSDAPSTFYNVVSNLTNGEWNDTGNGLLIGFQCKGAIGYKLLRYEIKSITPEGYLQQTNSLINRHNGYCLDVVDNKTDWNYTVEVRMCFPMIEKGTEYSQIRYVVNSVLEGISCVFLFLTLLVYICLPALQNLHGKTLMCHAASFLVSYICLAIIPWVTPTRSIHSTNETVFCATLGYVMFFSLLSSFSWLNVMCFDIWRTFGSLRGNFGRGRSHVKRFLWYCLYAWGSALFLTIFAIMCDQLLLLPENLRPNFGAKRCWFTKERSMFGELIFFRCPIAIQLIFNVVFFILTAEHCSKVKAEISRVADPSDPRSKRFHADKTKLIMNVKLFIVMGISWIAEIASSLMNRYTKVEWKDELFYASDVINCLQGLLIFTLFVLKPRVYQALRKRLGFEEKKCSSQDVWRCNE